MIDITDVYRAYGRLAYCVAHRIIGDRGLAEEATQTAFVRVWQARDRLDWASDMRALLCTAVRRAAIDITRRERRRPWASLSEATGATYEDDGIERAWITWRVREALQQLPDEEKEVVRLQHAIGLTHAQIATHLMVAIGTVKSRSHRAHRRLAALLGDLRPEVAVA